MTTDAILKPTPDRALAALAALQRAGLRAEHERCARTLIWSLAKTGKSNMSARKTIYETAPNLVQPQPN